jgi:hypothetical protein
MKVSLKGKRSYDEDGDPRGSIASINPQNKSGFIIAIDAIRNIINNGNDRLYKKHENKHKENLFYKH